MDGSSKLYIDPHPIQEAREIHQMCECKRPEKLAFANCYNDDVLANHKE